MRHLYRVSAELFVYADTEEDARERALADLNYIIQTDDVSIVSAAVDAEAEDTGYTEGES